MTDEQRLEKARGKILAALRARHPRGMTANQILQSVARFPTAAPLRDLLGRMRAEGLIERREVPARPHGPQDPMVEYYARSAP